MQEANVMFGYVDRETAAGFVICLCLTAGGMNTQ